MPEPQSMQTPLTEPTQWVRFCSSPIHGQGAFALRNIPSGTRILEYIGERIRADQAVEQCRQKNESIFGLDEGWFIDGNVPWNPARLLNHSCAPNCQATLDAQRIWLTALRDIAPGEELTFNYSYDLEDYRDYPCRCGSPNCVGYIVAEEFFEYVRGRGRAATDLKD